MAAATALAAGAPAAAHYPNSGRQKNNGQNASGEYANGQHANGQYAVGADGNLSAQIKQLRLRI